MTATYDTRGSVAVITLNNPPVNGLGLATRKGIAEGIERAQNDPAVKAIVITGAGKAFSGGADIKEFNSPKALAEPTLHTVINVVESSTKPVVAAMGSLAVQAQELTILWAEWDPANYLQELVNLFRRQLQMLIVNVTRQR